MFDGKVYYLFVVFGVDFGIVVKDFSMFDVQGVCVDCFIYGYVLIEVDVEIYFLNLQIKMILSMIVDGFDCLICDFDNFLEDNVLMEWENQRKCIYEYFGIKFCEESMVVVCELQGGFGCFRRSKV